MVTKIISGPSMVAGAFNSSTWEAEFKTRLVSERQREKGTALPDHTGVGAMGVSCPLRPWEKLAVVRNSARLRRL